MYTVARAALLAMFLTAPAPLSAGQTEAWHSLAVPTASFDMAGVPTQGDRSQLMLRLVRLIHALPEGVDKNVEPVRARLRAFLGDIDTAEATAPETIDVPLPLPPEVWSKTIFQRAVPARALFRTIIEDRNASLLYYGLCALTAETREFLQSNPALLRWIYREQPGTLAAYGGSLRMVNGAIDLPGGEAARPLWESLAGVPVSKPGDFLKQVLGRDDGRLAYLYESVDTLDAPRQRFALGLALRDAGARIDRLQTLYRAFVGVEAEWSQWAVPFMRPMYDAGTLLHVVRVTDDGALAGPSSRGLWRLAFDSPHLPNDPAGLLRQRAEEGELDAAALADLVALAPARYRRERFEAFAFGQRVFGGVSERHFGDVLVALRAFARFPAVMLILDRLGVTSPSLYASIARHALAIERVEDPGKQIPLLAQFQGALAVVDRLARTGRLGGSSVEPLLADLAAITLEEGGYHGRVAAWIEASLLPAIGRSATRSAGSAERELLEAFADTDADGARRFEWEGHVYEVRIEESERRRIGAVRAKLRGNSLDAALAFSRDVAALEERALTLERIKPAITSLGNHAADLAPGRPWPGLTVDDVPDVGRLVDRASDELRKIKRPRDLRRASRIASRLMVSADYLLGEVLVALAYAPALGDPESLLGGEADVAHRHDFAVSTAVNAKARTRGPWLRPRRTGPTITGAVLGLDLVFAPRALRRLAGDRVPELPRLKENDREVFATSVALMIPRRLTDSDVQRIAAGVREGRRRVLEAGSDVGRLQALAAAARMSPTRRQLLAWSASHDSGSTPSLFSMAELLEVGDAAVAGTSREGFGLSEEPLTGCYCIRFPAAGPWEIYSGRSGTGQLAMRVPDLTLRVTELLHDLKTPAVLLPWVLSLATHDFIHEVPALYGDDWAATIAYAQAVPRERIEDYVASLTAIGPLRPAASNPQ